MNLIIDVDTQNDFMDVGGKLYVPGAEGIKPALQRVMLAAIKNSMPIISTIDDHDENDPEFKTFPPHCIRGTEGVEKNAMTYAYGAGYRSHLINGSSRDWTKTLEESMQFVVHKQTYNVWDPMLGNPDAMMTIINHFRPKAIYLCGVATEICVLAAAKGLSKFLYDNLEFKIPNLWLIKDAIKGLSFEAEFKATEEIMNLGFARIDSSYL